VVLYKTVFAALLSLRWPDAGVAVSFRQQRNLVVRKDGIEHT
jgi:hypothetical protein